jgi:hypothetical protein
MAFFLTLQLLRSLVLPDDLCYGLLKVSRAVTSVVVLNRTSDFPYSYLARSALIVRLPLQSW